MIEYIEIKRYKSIKNLQLELKPINLLIGGNGVGKSNFISFFKLIHAIFNKRLQRYVIEESVDNILHFGRKNSASLFGKLIFDSGNGNNNAYYFELIPTNTGGMYIGEEGSGFNVNKDDNRHNYFYNRDLQESQISTSSTLRNNFLKEHLTNLQTFHFHDTSSTSYLRKPCDISDNLFLKQDGRNLPAFLYYLKNKHEKVYQRILKTIQSVAPYIHDFILEPEKLKDNKVISLRWIDIGDLNSLFTTYQLSDGTLRFVALTALLMQPKPPSVIIIDEPELGLHPFAIGKLAGMINLVSKKTQVIIATQSPGLISHFKPEDIIVMDKDRSENQTVFNRLQPEKLTPWLEEFSIGDLWVNNDINSGQPFIKE
jgi:predicted ATPase